MFAVLSAGVPPHFAAERNEFFIGQSAFGPVYSSVEYLRVLDAVFPTATDGDDVVQRCALGRQRPAGQGTTENLLIQELKNRLLVHGSI